MDYKRDSVASEVSEFSFEQNDEEVINPSNVSTTDVNSNADIPPASNYLRHTGSSATVTTNTLTYDQLSLQNVKLREENESLKAQLQSQELIISQLQEQIAELDKNTITTSERPSIAVPVTPTSSEFSNTTPTIQQLSEQVTANVLEKQQVDTSPAYIPSEEEAEMITVPVRSRQRHKPSPLRGLDGCDVDSTKDEDDGILTLSEGGDDSVATEKEEEERKPSLSEPLTTTAKSTNTSSAAFTQLDDILTGEFDSDSASSDDDINKSHLSTPSHSTATVEVDWDSTVAEIEKTSSSPDSTCLKSPLAVTSRTSAAAAVVVDSSPLSASPTPSRQQQNQLTVASSSTPYRNGRISSAETPSPSPRRVLTPIHDNVANQTLIVEQSESLNSSSSTVNQNNFSNTDQMKNKPQRINLAESSDYTPKASSPISPVRYAALTNAQHEHQMQQQQRQQQQQPYLNLSSPTTPTNSSLYDSGSRYYNSEHLSPSFGAAGSQSQHSLSHSMSHSSLASSTYSNGSAVRSMAVHHNISAGVHGGGDVYSPSYRQQASPTSTHNVQQQQQQMPKREPVPAQFPTDVPLFIQPDQLSTIKLRIISTICTANLKKSDEPFITISVRDRTTDKEIWRFRKTHTQFLQLDNHIRPSLMDLFSVPPLPDKALFQSTIPTKVDQRRSQLTDYVLSLFHIPQTPLEVAYQLARFVSQDTVNLLDEINTDVAKEGWLLRKGKGLKGGSWKVRYAQIDGPFMNVYETNPNVLLNSGKTANGAIVEAIRLTGAQIGRQPSTTADSEKNGFRHAFAVMELKKGNSGNFNRFVFCSETDYDRDEWIQTLLNVADPTTATTTTTTTISANDSDSVYSSSIRGDSSFIASSSSQAVLESPVNSEFSAVRYQDVEEKQAQSATDDLEDSLSLREKEKELKKQRKKSFFPFAKKSTNANANANANASGNITVEDFNSNNGSSINSIQQDHQQLMTDSFSNIEKSLQSMNLNTNQPSQSNRIFQNENLDEILTLCPTVHKISNLQVPSIIYRCLTFLTSNNAIQQEGIFRLSGSAALIKQLREQFDTQFDVDFESMQPKPDINTIAGLLKLWFRELPSSIVPREIQMDLKTHVERFAHDHKSIAKYYGETIGELQPLVVQSILAVLFQFLHNIVMNSEINKMNLRNLCIVFSPTLNLQAECLVPLILDYGAIFEGKEVLNDSQRREIEGNVISSF